MKRTIQDKTMTVRRAVAAGVIVLALAGCSSPPTPSAPETSAASKPAAPNPNEVQRKALLADIGRLVPKVPAMDVITKSRYLCTHALRGTSKKGLETAAARVFSLPADRVTAAEAAKIVAAVRKNGFCK